VVLRLALADQVDVTAVRLEVHTKVDHAISAKESVILGRRSGAAG
jgi:hypothetical protein